MTNKPLVRDRAFQNLVKGLALFSLAYIPFMFWQWGGQPFFDWHANVVTVFSAALAFVLSGMALSLVKEPRLRRIWYLLTGGLALWSLAEGAWAYYELIARIELPYPSPADFIWLAGYILVGLALWKLYRFYGLSLRGRQRVLFWVVLALILGISFYSVLWPVISEFDAAALLEGFFNLAYPLADLALLTLTMLVALSFGKGQAARVWRLVGAGLALLTIADNMFIYLDWNDLYYPDGAWTFASALSDYVYILGYFLLALGFYGYYRLLKTGYLNVLALQSDEATIPLVARHQALIFTDRDGYIISATKIVQHLWGFADERSLRKKKLDEVFPADLVQEFLSRMQRHQFIRNWLITLPIGDKRFPVRVSAIGVRDGSGALNGSNILLGFLSDLDVDDDGLNEELQGMARHIAEVSQVVEQEERAVLLAFAETMRSYSHQLVEAFKGQRLAAAFDQELQAALRAAGFSSPLSGGQADELPDLGGEDLLVWYQAFEQALAEKLPAFVESKPFAEIKAEVFQKMDERARQMLRDLGVTDLQ